MCVCSVCVVCVCGVCGVCEVCVVCEHVCLCIPEFVCACVCRCTSLEKPSASSGSWSKWGSSGGVCKWSLGDRLWWQLEPKQQQCGVQTTRLSLCHCQLLGWCLPERSRKHLVGRSQLYRTRGVVATLQPCKHRRERLLSCGGHSSEVQPNRWASWAANGLCLNFVTLLYICVLCHVWMTFVPTNTYILMSLCDFYCCVCIVHVVYVYSIHCFVEWHVSLSHVHRCRLHAVLREWRGIGHWVVLVWLPTAFYWTSLWQWVTSRTYLLPVPATWSITVAYFTHETL